MNPIRPREGFDWLLVNWGGPDQHRTDCCSYCGDLFPVDYEGGPAPFDAAFVPLVLFREDGWVAEFCDHCQATWFGIRKFAEPVDDTCPDCGSPGNCAPGCPSRLVD